ncbi:MAG: hypothetical protein [Caudoviricetes sp.]|nr:MAG: hypothetical protein [Caudoviricetes sp.]
MIIQELAYKVSLQASEFLNGKRQVQAASEELAGNLANNNKKVQTQLSSLTQGMDNFGKTGKNAFSLVQSSAAKFLGVALTLEGARRLFMGTTDQLVRMGNTSAFLGMSTQSLDGFTKAAQAAGASGQSMGGVLMRLKNAQLWQQTGMGAPDESTIAMLQAQGATGVNIIGAQNPGQALLRMRTALMRMPDAQRQYMAGRMGVDPDLYEAMMRPDFARNVNQYTQNSSMTDPNVKRAQQIQKALTDLQQTAEGVGATLVQVFGPDITNGLHQLDQWIRQNKGSISGFFQELSSDAERLTNAMGGIGNLLKVYAGWRVGGLPGAVAATGGITAESGWNSMMDNRNHAYGNVTTAGGNLKKNSPLGRAWDWTASHFDTLSAMAGFGDAKADTVTPSIPGVTTGVSRNGLLNAIMMTESGGNPMAYSSAGAAGAFQFMPGTARSLGLHVGSDYDDRLDPNKSRAAASIYMSRLLSHYDGNVNDALRAYNWGEGNMDKWIAGGRTGFMPKETQEYAGKVARYYSQMASTAMSPSTGYGSVDNSQQNSTHIGTVNVTTNADSIDSLTASIEEQAKRSRVTVAFSGGVA